MTEFLEKNTYDLNAVLGGKMKKTAKMIPTGIKLS